MLLESFAALLFARLNPFYFAFIKELKQFLFEMYENLKILNT